MAAKIEPRLPRGMRDILPQRMIQRQYVIDVIRGTFEQFGFEELQTPAIELEEILTGKSGPDADRLMYSVGHREGKERLALRYDLTVPLCRVVAQYPDLIKPFKRFQIAPVWRAERPQKGRYREFYQCDADTVGSSSMLADAETINIIYEILTRLGFRQFVTEINNRKIINAIGEFAGVPEPLRGGLYRAIDKLDKIGLEGVRDELRRATIPEEAVERLLAFLQIDGGNREVLAQLRRWLGDYPVAMEGIAEMEEIIDYLEALGIPGAFYQVRPAMVRGLEYYTGPIYETLVEEPKIGSITGGGRYDQLIGMFMERSLPVTGTTIGIERIIDVMEELKMFPPAAGQTVTQVLVTRFSAETVLESLRLASELRRAGLNVEMSFQDASLGNQIRYALKKGIPYVAIVGPDEARAGLVALRNIAQEAQETVPRGGAAARIRAWQEERRG